MNQTIKEKYYFYKREQLLKRLIQQLGNGVIEEDKIVFYFDEQTLKKRYKKIKDYILVLNKINGLKDHELVKTRELLESYGLNKPFYYIFDGITFDKKVILDEFSLDKFKNTTIFRNCTFKKGIEIKRCDNIIFENNKYYCHSCYDYANDQGFLVGKNIKKITFINEFFLNADTDHHPIPRFGINLETKQLEIIDSKIIIDTSIIHQGKEFVPNKGEICIKAKETKIVNSLLDSSNIYLDSELIAKDNSHLMSSEGIIIETQTENMNLSNIKTPYFIYNGIELNKHPQSDEDVTLENLKKERYKLVETIKKVKDKINQINQEQLTAIIENTTNNLNNTPLKRVLKK